MNLLHKSCFVSLVIIIAVVSFCDSDLIRRKRLVKGKEAKPLAWPWEALILQGSEDWNICGGSLISENWVLTAGHCVRSSEGQKPYKYKIVLGEHSRNKSDGTEVFSDIAEIHSFPKYETTNHSYDMALIKLKTAVDFTKHRYLKPACLRLSKTKLKNRRCVGAGWGRLGSSGPMPDVLQELEMKEFCHSECAELHNDWYQFGPSYEKVIDTHVCMVSRTNPYPESGDSYGGVCAGDSGSPLQCLFDKTWWQVGVAWSATDCEQNPSVFNRVDMYSRWIESTSGYKVPDYCFGKTHQKVHH